MIWKCIYIQMLNIIHTFYNATNTANTMKTGKPTKIAKALI